MPLSKIESASLETAITADSLGVTGNLTFTGTGNRITGDFSNATVANRVAFQTSTANGASRLLSIPNGTGDSSAFATLNSSDANNASWTQISTNAANSLIQATISGTGTYLPMVFQTGGSERVRIDTSGNVGIGTSTPSFPLDVAGAIRSPSWIGRTNVSVPTADCAIYRVADNTLAFSTVSTERARIDSSGNVNIGSSANYGGILSVNRAQTSGIADLLTLRDASTGATFNLQTYADPTYGTANRFNYDSVYLAFRKAGTEQMRLDSSGNLLVGTTTFASGQNGVLMRGTSGGATDEVLQVRTSGTGSKFNTAFYNDNGRVGSIQTSGSSTSYVTSSDYRLKENIAPMIGALAKVALLKPVTYKWKVDGSDGQGFIAHELQVVVPDCVTGEKDAVDAEGNPQYQGIDTSFLVATLAAAIQELKAIVDAQGAEIAALKGTP